MYPAPVSWVSPWNKKVFSMRNQWLTKPQPFFSVAKLAPIEEVEWPIPEFQTITLTQRITCAQIGVVTPVEVMADPVFFNTVKMLIILLADDMTLFSHKVPLYHENGS